MGWKAQYRLLRPQDLGWGARYAHVFDDEVWKRAPSPPKLCTVSFRDLATGRTTAVLTGVPSNERVSSIVQRLESAGIPPADIVLGEADGPPILECSAMTVGAAAAAARSTPRGAAPPQRVGDPVAI